MKSKIIIRFTGKAGIEPGKLPMIERLLPGFIPFCWRRDFSTRNSNFTQVLSRKELFSSEPRPAGVRGLRLNTILDPHWSHGHNYGRVTLPLLKLRDLRSIVVQWREGSFHDRLKPVDRVR